MFTHEYATPRRLEALLELLHEQRDDPLRDEQVDLLMQPAGNDKGERQQAAKLREALVALGLAGSRADKRLTLTAPWPPTGPSETLLDAFDRMVLARDDVEPYFALYYAYLLGRPRDWTWPSTRQARVDAFKADVFGSGWTDAGGERIEAFTATKETGQHRWFGYVGLGWYDPGGTFQCNPAGRLQRALPALFSRRPGRLAIDAFMDKLAEHCPELDGGPIFVRANRGYDPRARRCTLGLGHALVDLHAEGTIRLHCPRDSRGWSIDECEPRFDENTLLTEKVETVEWLQA